MQGQTTNCIVIIMLVQVKFFHKQATLLRKYNVDSDYSFCLR